MMSSTVKFVRRGNVGSRWSLLLIYVHALVMGMAVKREITSIDTITSSLPMERLAISLENWDEFFSEKPFLFCSGDKISVKNLEVLYRVEFVQVTMGLSGLTSLRCLTEPLMVGGAPSVEHSLR